MPNEISQGSRATVFISYSSKDKDELTVVQNALKWMEDDGYVLVHLDDRISSGTDWEQTIRKYIAEDDVIILILTSNFAASDFIRVTELPAILERWQSESPLELIPIWVEGKPPAEISNAKIQCTPRDPIKGTHTGNEAKAWADVVGEVQRTIMRRFDEKNRTHSGPQATQTSQACWSDEIKLAVSTCRSFWMLTRTALGWHQKLEGELRRRFPQAESQVREPRGPLDDMDQSRFLLLDSSSLAFDLLESEEQSNFPNERFQNFRDYKRLAKAHREELQEDWGFHVRLVDIPVSWGLLIVYPKPHDDATPLPVAYVELKYSVDGHKQKLIERYSLGDLRFHKVHRTFQNLWYRYAYLPSGAGSERS